MKKLFLLALFFTLFSASFVLAEEAKENEPIKITAFRVENTRDFGIPWDIKWIGAKPYFCFLKGNDRGMVALEIWTENKEKKWQFIYKVENINPVPIIFVSNDYLGIITAGRSEQGDRTKFYKISGDKGEFVTDIQPTILTSSRMRAGHAHCDGKQISFITGMRSIFFLKSKDGGKTWICQPIKDNCKSFFTSTQIDEKNILVCVTGNNDAAHIMRSTDGGDTWKEEKLLLKDNKPADAKRIPLRMFSSGEKTNMVYVVAEKDMPKRQDLVYYYFTQSKDKGKTWSEGVTISKKTHMMDNPELLLRTAVLDENKIAVSIIDQIIQDRKGENERRTLKIECVTFYTSDSGKTWTEINKRENFPPTTSTIIVSASPDGKRLLVGGAYSTDVGEADFYTLFIKDITGIFDKKEKEKEKEKEEEKDGEQK